MTTGFTQVWGRNTNLNRGEVHECPGNVIDVQARGSVYILASNQTGSTWYVQKRGLGAGELLWSITIDPDAIPFDGHRIDSDDTTVWVVSRSSSTLAQYGLIAYSADDGTYLWKKSGNFYDVDPDGAGGCVAVRDGLGSGCFGGGTTGSVVQYDSDGNIVLSFGLLNIWRSLLVVGDKVWVGGRTTGVGCFCETDDITIKGCLVRHSLTTGNVELVCAGGEWVESSGCKAQEPILGFDAYVNRIIMGPTGHILCGIYDADDGSCLMFEVNASTGKFEAGYDISDLRTTFPYTINSIMSMAVVSGTIYVVATNGSRGGLILSTGGLVKKHNGYYKDLYAAPAYMHAGSYMTVSDSGSDLITGGEEAGCVLYDDNVSPGAIIEGDCDQPCECGDFNTRGQAVVGCGCEDGVEPSCAAYIIVEFTGCLGGLSGTIPMTYFGCVGGSCYDCAEVSHHWTGSTTGNYYPFGPDNTSINCCEIVDGEETENCSPCCASLSCTVDVCYECGTGWVIKFCISGNAFGYGAFAFSFFVTVEEENCNPPSFTFTFDGEGIVTNGSGATDNFLENCCGGLTGCGGFITTGCGPSTDCCGSLENEYPVTLSSAVCPYANGATGTATWNPSINAWECILEITTAVGVKTWGFALACPEAGGSASDFTVGPLLSGDTVNCEPDSSYQADFDTAECSPLSLTFTDVTFAHNGLGVCCDDGTPMSPAATATIVIG